MATKKAPEPDVQPRPTVRDAARSILGAATLIAGAQGLDRPVEWVRLMETPEVQPRAGDLLFTTGFPIKDDPDAQIRLVSRIAESGGAGLVVRPMPYLRKLPPEMVSEADRLHVPLFTVGADVQLIDLMAPLLERIINAEHWRLKRSIEIHHRFTELVLDGKGVNEICRTLADLLESAVVVEDASFHLLAHAGGSADPHRKETILRQGTPQRVLFDPQIQRVLREVEAKRGPLKVPAFPHLGMSRERLIAPILAANQVLGYISILDHPPQNEELAFMAIEQAALVLALSIAKEHELSEVEGRVRGEFLEDLLHGTYGEESAAQRRARHIGYPLHGSHIVMLVDIDDFRGFNRARQITEDAIQALKREFLRRVAGRGASQLPARARPGALRPGGLPLAPRDRGGRPPGAKPRAWGSRSSRSSRIGSLASPCRSGSVARRRRRSVSQARCARSRLSWSRWRASSAGARWSQCRSSASRDSWRL